MYRTTFIVFLISLTFPETAHSEERRLLKKGWDDIESVDMKDLWLDPPSYPDEDNAMEGLAEIEKKIDEMEGEEWIISNMSSDLESYQKALSFYPKIDGLMKEADVLLERKHLVENFKEYSSTLNTPMTLSIMKLSRAFSLRVHWLLSQKRNAEAVKAYKQMCKLSQKMGKHQYTLVNYLVFQYLEVFEISLADLLLQQVKDEESRQVVFREMHSNKPNKDILKLAFRGELNYIYNILIEYQEGEFSFNITHELMAEALPDFFEPPSELENIMAKIMYKISLLGLQGNRTVSLFVGDYQRRVKILDMKPAKILETLEDWEKKHSQIDNLYWLSSNLTGRGIHYTSGIVIDRQIRRMFNLQINIDFVKMRDAMRRYKSDHGRFPDSLNALVPKYLAELPKDVFSPDDSPYQYDAKKQVIWGIGFDREVKWKEPGWEEKTLDFSVGNDPNMPYTYLN